MADPDWNQNGDAFQELNGLTIVVGNDENVSVQETTTPAIASLPLHTSHDCDHSHGEDILLKALASPFPNLSKVCSDLAHAHEDLCYLNLAPIQSDQETFSKVSGDSSSSHDLSQNMNVAAPYLDRRMLAISEICGNATVTAAPSASKTSNKRKALVVKTTSNKRGKTTRPSKFCHICVRSGEQVSLVPCANVLGASCRKAVCQKCFYKHGFGNEWAHACANRDIIKVHSGQLAQAPHHAWTCLHCRSLCPESAQCKIYARTNKRRHMILKQRKAEKGHVVANRDDRRTARPQGAGAQVHAAASWAQENLVAVAPSAPSAVALASSILDPKISLGELQMPLGMPVIDQMLLPQTIIASSSETPRTNEFTQKE